MTEQQPGRDLPSRIAHYTYRMMLWGKNHVPVGIRSLLGLLFMVGGVFGFLPVLGFWMLPLGVAFIALDVPPARRHLDEWIEKLKHRAYHSGEAQTHEPPDSTSNQ